MNSFKISLIVFVAFLTSCTTYQIPIESFETQLKDATFDNMKTVNTKYPTGITYQNLANQLDSIICVDKNGNTRKIQNKPSIEIRITDKKNKKTIFYFDTVYLSDSFVVGQQSRFISATKSIPLKDIIKIEIQDCHKKFSYK
ncbi:hypothetical protein E2605_06640 [Dysgonomonas capnocytophagoides]|uniref:Lipoprotein n=1 Tax=Dysgonomonas capnocytophagoides TaxID=45254 RepID=A0A4Y8L8E6_9BACT|nr:hypothetical protein [Dysgonomonas capnocytophagoides]TFD97340.1 hypothetical protein E2605_06640 [Dysgonomonas capnocytophagoides]